MVLLKTTLAGAALILLGLAALVLLAPYVTMEVRNVQEREVERRAQFLVGDVADRQYTLPANVEVFGTGTVAEAPSNQSSEIRFIVLDTENYQRWLSGGQAEFMYSAQEPGSFNYTFHTANIGVYHFVFDNRDSVFKKYVALSVSFNEVISKQVPDTRFQYLAWALIAVGAVALVYGVVRRPQVHWA